MSVVFSCCSSISFLYALVDYFYCAVAFHVASCSVSVKSIVIGARRAMGLGWVPEIFFATDVANVINGCAPSVVYDELRMLVALEFEKIDYCETVIVSVVVGRYDVREL